MHPRLDLFSGEVKRENDAFNNFNLKKWLQVKCCCTDLVLMNITWNTLFSYGCWNIWLNGNNHSFNPYLFQLLNLSQAFKKSLDISHTIHLFMLLFKTFS